MEEPTSISTSTPPVANPWVELEDLLVFYTEYGIPTIMKDRDFAKAFWIITSIAAVGTILYVILMKSVRNSDMDRVFTDLYRLQATEALITVFSQAAALWVTSSDYVEGTQRNLVCRSLLTTALAFYLSYFFTLMMIAFTRCLYIIFPLYIHHLPHAVLHLAIGIGWAVYIISSAVLVYNQEIWSLFLFYACLGVYGTPLLKGNLITTLSLLVSGLTSLLYAFILVMQYKSKVPQRRRNVQLRNRATLMTCMVHFGVQLLEMLAQVLFKLTRYREPSGLYSAFVIGFQATIRVIISPLILVFLMRRGRQHAQ